MPDTLQALLITFIAVLPGALYTWAFEREVGRWGIGLSDRVLRFVGTSGLLLAAYAYPLYLLWTHYLHARVVTEEGVVFRNLVAEGASIPWWLFLVPVTYVGLPLALGTFGALAVNRGWTRIARVVAGRDPAPRAWDFLFSPRPAGLVRARLKGTDGWVGGLFGGDSYAAGYPESPQDIYLERTYVVEADGSFARDAQGNPQELGSGILVRADDILHLEFVLLESEEG